MFLLKAKAHINSSLTQPLRSVCICLACFCVHLYNVCAYICTHIIYNIIYIHIYIYHRSYIYILYIHKYMITLVCIFTPPRLCAFFSLSHWPDGARVVHPPVVWSTDRAAAASLCCASCRRSTFHHLPAAPAVELQQCDASWKSDTAVWSSSPARVESPRAPASSARMPACHGAVVPAETPAASWGTAVPRHLRPGTDDPRGGPSWAYPPSNWGSADHLRRRHLPGVFSTSTRRWRWFSRQLSSWRASVSWLAMEVKLGTFESANQELLLVWSLQVMFPSILRENTRRFYPTWRLHSSWYHPSAIADELTHLIEFPSASIGCAFSWIHLNPLS